MSSNLTLKLAACTMGLVAASLHLIHVSYHISIKTQSPHGYWIRESGMIGKSALLGFRRMVICCLRPSLRLSVSNSSLDATPAVINDQNPTWILIVLSSGHVMIPCWESTDSFGHEASAFMAPATFRTPFWTTAQAQELKRPDMRFATKVKRWAAASCRLDPGIESETWALHQVQCGTAHCSAQKRGGLALGTNAMGRAEPRYYYFD